MSEWFNAGRISPVPSGTWNDTAAYTRLDIVTDTNMQRSYIAKKDVPAGTPLTDANYWQLLVETFHAVSLKTAADRLASPFSETSSAVACHPVEDYPLDVVTHIEPVQEGSGEPSPDNIRPITGHTGDVLTRCEDHLMTPANVAHYVLLAWQQRNFDSLYPLLSSQEDVKNRPAQALFSDAFADSDVLILYSLTPGSIAVDGQSAVVCVDMTLRRQDGSEYTMNGWPLKLKREGGAWKASLSALQTLMQL